MLSLLNCPSKSFDFSTCRVIFFGFCLLLLSLFPPLDVEPLPPWVLPIYIVFVTPLHLLLIHPLVPCCTAGVDFLPLHLWIATKIPNLNTCLRWFKMSATAESLDSIKWEIYCNHTAWSLKVLIIRLADNYTHWIRCPSISSYNKINPFLN